MSNIATTNTNGNDQVNLPFGRLESTHFGTYDIWQEKTIVGKKTHRHEVDVNMGMRKTKLLIVILYFSFFLGSTSVVSRIHFELILLNGTDFQLKCLSKNGIFINNNYLKMSSISVLPKQYDKSSSYPLFIDIVSFIDVHFVFQVLICVLHFHH
jgi:hypothetical protein